MTDITRRKVIHYGSLEEQERKRIESGETSSGSLAGDAIKSGISVGNINLGATDGPDILETVSSTTAEILAEFERRKKVIFYFCFVNKKYLCRINHQLLKLNRTNLYVHLM